MKTIALSNEQLDCIYNALDLAKCEIHNMIATCPDVNLYAKDIADYKAQSAEIEALQAYIMRAAT